MSIKSVNSSQLRYDCAIIDLDGTMVDTMGDFELALNNMLADIALPAVDRAFIERTVGKGSEHLVRTTLQHALRQGDHGGQLMHVPEPLFAKALTCYQGHYVAVNGHNSAVYSGVIAGLQRLRDHGLRLACLTNKPTPFALPLLKSKGLDGFFEHAFGGDAFAQKKPHPLPLLRTCEALGSNPVRTLMVGDSSNDAKAARAAMCPVVLVRYGYNHGEAIETVDADGYLDSLEHITLV